MSSSKKTEFVFRGTTEEYPGGRNSIEMPYTCTSSHPLKALWFALECFQQNPDTACVYVARTENLKQIRSGYNHFHKLESEIGFFIQPTLFYPFCDGLIYVTDFQEILMSFGFQPYVVARIENLTQLCKETPKITATTVRSIVGALMPVCKKITNL